MIKMMASPSKLDQMILDGKSKSHSFAETLVDQYYDYILRLAISILGDPADAEDVCQETLIDALLYIDRYSPGTNLKAWLSKIAVHKCRQVQRKRKVSDTLNALIRHGSAVSSKPSTPFETALEKEETDQIWAGIDALIEKHRIPVILYYVYEFKIREIAAILDIPEGTVSSRLHYAVQKLGDRLRGLDKSPGNED